ncbi:hypothetical protein [Roseomonas sp. WA12]
MVNATQPSSFPPDCHPPTSAPTHRFRVLVVEDEWLIASEVADCLEEAGLEVLGPVPTVAGALRLIEIARADGGIAAAVLDFSLNGSPVTPVADALTAIGVPFFYASGYPAGFLPGFHVAAPLLVKPFARDALLHHVLSLGATGASKPLPA